MVTILFEMDYSLDSLADYGVSNEEAQEIEVKLGLRSNEREKKIDFVGLIETKTKQFFSLPKFFKKSDVSQCRVVVDILRYIAANQKSIDRFPDAYLFDKKQVREGSNKLDIAEFLLEDFHSHGLLVIKRHFYKRSESRSAAWERTVNSLDPVWSEGQPFYGQWFSKYSENAEDRLLTEIHRSIIVHCAVKYGSILGFKNVFRANTVSLPVTPQYAITIARSALRRTFSLREINVLHALIAWLETQRDAGVFFFGTRYFNLVWEEVCSFLLNDVKESPDWVGVMPKPAWHIWSESKSYLSKRPFSIDCLTELPDSKGLLLTDAKYYLPSFLGDSADGVPGVDSLSKQLHYEQLIISSGSFLIRFESDRSKLINAFVFPGTDDTPPIWPFGEVMIPRIKSSPIICIYLGGMFALDRYLKQRSFTHAELTALCELIDNRPSL